MMIIAKLSLKEKFPQKLKVQTAFSNLGYKIVVCSLFPWGSYKYGAKNISLDVRVILAYNKFQHMKMPIIVPTLRHYVA